MQSSAKTVAAYLKELPDDEVRRALTKLRTLIRKTIPDAVESMQYGMPAIVAPRAVAASPSG